MVTESEKIIYHETLDVLRSVSKNKEEQSRLVRLVTVCTKSVNCADALKMIAQIHEEKARFISSRWPGDDELCKYNVAAIYEIYKEYMDKASGTERENFRDTDDMDLLTFHRSIQGQLKRQK